MKSLVEKLGHVVVPAHDGKLAVHLAQQHLPQLVLLDIVMPEQDGFVTCRQIKRGSTTSHIPVVLVSSKNTESDQFWGLRQGASEYITKPFNPSALASAVERMLNS